VNIRCVYSRNLHVLPITSTVCVRAQKVDSFFQYREIFLFVPQRPVFKHKPRMAAYRMLWALSPMPHTPCLQYPLRTVNWSATFGGVYESSVFVRLFLLLVVRHLMPSSYPPRLSSDNSEIHLHTRTKGAFSHAWSLVNPLFCPSLSGGRVSVVLSGHVVPFSGSRFCPLRVVRQNALLFTRPGH